eukprot:scaffold43088_cov64-Phaeocystis_antarctica.AAC.6
MPEQHAVCFTRRQLSTARAPAGARLQLAAVRAPRFRGAGVVDYLDLGVVRLGAHVAVKGARVVHSAHEVRHARRALSRRAILHGTPGPIVAAAHATG